MGYNIVGRTDAIHCEDKHFPVVIGTFFGAASEPVVLEYFQWLTRQSNRLKSSRERLVNVSDLGLASAPNAAMRRFIADQTNVWSATLTSPQSVYAIAIVESVIIKGVLQTLAWLQGNMQVQYVTSRKTALVEAVRLLREHTLPIPAGVETAALLRPVRPVQSGDG